MNQLTNSLELNRKHIADAFIHYCRLRNGGTAVLNLMVKKQVVALDNLTASAVENCLIHSIELQCFSKFGRDRGLPMLVETYAGMTGKDNSRLTPEGVEFMNEVMTAAITAALANPKDNNFGLEIYHA
ncbi:hypothetical protein HX37_17600 [Salmonella enterica]|uniref:Uncharacterized protein n=1 Tax=Salmonella enterica TaxID=28901 RepID=A0A5U2F285_SALER|nr:hypothetical protein [Salmonella enterica]HDN5824361.1 hypothetical protein [Salmonella enterica subsp. enterica serovar Anatum]EBB9142157.1 hypothetical protein [Salmonella enterica]EBP0012588.1 hypothetical protein [Salmonella enterica]EHE5993979.1 hypothetical protein [Salmonella enterica]EHI2600984.1 hypothetical protein [Salmonella enterica]